MGKVSISQAVDVALTVLNINKHQVSFSRNTLEQVASKVLSVSNDINQESQVKNEDDEVKETPSMKRPTLIKKGDVFTGLSINGKSRPFVVAKVVGEQAYTIALTTTEDSYTSIPHNSRFLDKGFYTNSFVVVSIEQIRKKFKGVMDDNRNLNKAIKIITEKNKQEIIK